MLSGALFGAVAAFGLVALVVLFFAKVDHWLTRENRSRLVRTIVIADLCYVPLGMIAGGLGGQLSGDPTIAVPILIVAGIVYAVAYDIRSGGLKRRPADPDPSQEG